MCPHEFIDSRVSVVYHIKRYTYIYGNTIIIMVVGMSGIHVEHTIDTIVETYTLVEEEDGYRTEKAYAKVENGKIVAIWIKSGSIHYEYGLRASGDWKGIPVHEIDTVIKILEKIKEDKNRC